MEEQAAYLQQLKERAGLDPANPRDQLLAELTDTVSLLCHQLYSQSAVVDGLNQSLEEFQMLLDLAAVEEEPEDGIEDYFEGSERHLYEVKCPSCSDRFAVDEQTLLKGFSCPNCGEKLIQAES